MTDIVVPVCYPPSSEVFNWGTTLGNAVFYVDGMNAYHGIRSKFGREFLWLDLYALASRLREPDTILAVRYFTTIVAGEPEAARRQETYLSALAAYRQQVQVVRGRST